MNHRVRNSVYHQVSDKLARKLSNLANELEIEGVALDILMLGAKYLQQEVNHADVLHQIMTKYPLGYEDQWATAVSDVLVERIKTEYMNINRLS